MLNLDGVRDRGCTLARFVPAGVLTRMLSGGGQAESGVAILSFVVPSLLFDDVTLKKPSSEIPKPPVVKHPYFDK